MTSKPDHTAWARLFYEERDRFFRGRLEVVQEMAALLNGPPLSKTEGEETLWSECWNQTIWGSSLSWTRWSAQHTTPPVSRPQRRGVGPIFGRGRKPLVPSPVASIPLFRLIDLSLTFVGWIRLLSCGMSCVISARSRMKRLAATKWPPMLDSQQHRQRPATTPPSHLILLQMLAWPRHRRQKGAAKAGGKGSQSSQATPPPA